MQRICAIHIILFLFLLVCGSTRLQAQQPVVITGAAPFAPNEEIRLLVFDDLLNNIPTVVAHDKIDKNGRFKLSYPTTDIKMVQLAIRTMKAEFFIAPFQSYHFNITADTLLFKLLHPETYGGFLQITTEKSDTAELNYKINRFSRHFNRIVTPLAFRLTYDHNRNAYDTIYRQVADLYPVVYDPQNFYLSYIYYTLGQIEQFVDRRIIFPKYFDHDIVQYNNPAYMALFNQQFSGYLYNSRHVPKELLSRTVNEQPDYLTLFNEVGRDPALTNERLRELVIIKNLGEWLDHEEFDRGNVIKLLKYIQVSTHFPEHLPFINHILQRATPTNEEQTAVVFKNEKGRNVRLNQLSDKPIYVHLFQSDCIDCIREMLLLKEFYETFKDHIQFVSLCLDPTRATYEQFCKTYKGVCEWPVLHFNGNYDWLMENLIEALPDYLLCDAEGRITKRYVPAPENGLLQYLNTLFPPETEENNNPLFRNNKP